MLQDLRFAGLVGRGSGVNLVLLDQLRPTPARAASTGETIMRKVHFALAACAAAMFTAPVLAQQSSYTPGVYWEVSSITVEPGQDENYVDWLATQWRTQEEFSKSRGWIREYHVLANNNRRANEPDLYLVEVYDHVPTTAEQVQRQRAFEQMMSRDPHQLSTESGGRATMRRLTGSMLLQELNLRAH
jgi:hypothetical protein